MTKLEVPYNEKDAAKVLGARWNKEQGFWYVPDGIQITPFEKWLPKYASSKSEKSSQPKPTKNKSSEKVAKVQTEWPTNIGKKFFKIDHACIPWEPCATCAKDSRMFEWSQ